MHRGSIFWGLMLVLLGGLLLAQNMNLLPANVDAWAIFWSVLLVGFGLTLLLRNMRPRPTLSEDSSRINVETSRQGVEMARPAPAQHPGEAVRIPLGDARQAAVIFRHGAGELRMDGNAAPDELFSGIFNGGLDHRESRNGDQVTAELRVPEGNIGVVMPPFGFSEGLNWTVGLNPNIPLRLDLEVGASRNFLNLRDLQVKDLRLQTGASATEIDFPNRAGETRASLHSGLASVEVRIPDNVSASIHTRGGLSSINVNTQRFPQVGQGEYRSPDYEVSANRVDLEVESGVGSVNIR